MMEEVEIRKKCDSNTPIVACGAFFVLFFVSQVKVSPISNLLATTYTRSDQGSSPTVSLGSYSQAQALPSSVGPMFCNRSHFLYDICSMDGPTVLDPKEPTLYVMGQTNSPPQVEKVRPYPRKWDIFKMSHFKEMTLTSAPISPPCMVQHNASALVFSVGGYTGNFYTDFSEEFIPLFITIDSIFSDKDHILVISNVRDWWMWKYTDLLRSFSKHPIINLDNETSTHCFPSATVGLMTIDPNLIPNSKIILHFHNLLKKIYGHNNSPIVTLPTSQPRLLLAGRSGTIGRVILNRAEAKRVAEEEGFEVLDFEPTYSTTMREAYDLVSSSHVMVGVHGAALTHSLFLRPGSIFVQIVPIGTKWLAKMCFGNWARDVGLDYTEYIIKVGESSLVEKYSRDDIVLRDPNKVLKDPKDMKGKWGGWSSDGVEIYLMKQNVRLDLVRFRGCLKKAFVKAKAFMEKEG